MRKIDSQSDGDDKDKPRLPSGFTDDLHFSSMDQKGWGLISTCLLSPTSQKPEMKKLIRTLKNKKIQISKKKLSELQSSIWNKSLSK